MDLYDEFASIIAALEVAGVPYAVCGGMAMAIHGFPRATVDVDLLVPIEAADRVFASVRPLGYDLVADPMTFADGAVEMRRVTKVDPAAGDLLSLDLVLVTPAAVQSWNSRMRIAWERGELTVVSRPGLVALKKLRGSGQDQDDIRNLEGVDP